MSRGWKTALPVAGAFAACYFVGGWLGLALARLHPSVSAVWPPSGIAIGGLLLLGPRYWPAVAVAAFAVNLATSGDAVVSAGIAIGNTWEALAAAWLTNRFAGGRAGLERPRSFFAFLLYAAVGSTMISATIGVNCLVASGALAVTAFGEAWTTWWLGDLVGTVLFAPCILVTARHRDGWTRTHVGEGAILLVVLAGVSWVAFGPLFFGEATLPHAWLPLPLLIWAGFRFRPHLAVTACLVMAVIAVWCTLDGFGPFARLPGAAALLQLQVFLGFMAATTLTVALAAEENRSTSAALLQASRVLEQRVHERTAKLREANEVLAGEIGERAEAQRELARSEARLREFVEHAPDAIVVVDAAGCIQVVNAQTERFFGYDRRELVGQPVELLVPERLRGRHVEARAAFFANPHVRTMGEGVELYGRRKNGSEFPIDISLSPLQTSDGPAVAAAIRDVSKRQQWEKERLANESLRSQVAELSRRSQEIGILNRMADMLRAATTPAEAYPLVAPFLEELFPANSGAIYVFDESRARLDAVALWGKSPPQEPVLAVDGCWALRRGQAHCLLPQTNPLACQHLPQPAPEMSMCIPMVAKAETLGLFYLHRVAAPAGAPRHPATSQYSEYKQRLAQVAAEQIAGALANARLHEQLRAQAIRDPLTGLLNRRNLELSLEHELHRAQRRGSKLGVLMVDIDHFKKWNDRHGHAAGDTVLRTVARFLAGITRKEDFVCRYGGEEITLVLADCSLPDLRRRAEQICRGLRSLPIEFDGRALGTVTVSVGAAMYPDHGDGAADLLRAADSAMYRAKAAGRDRVEIAPSDREGGGRIRVLRPSPRPRSRS